MTWTEIAEADLDEIWHFSRERWDEEQADRYLARLNAEIGDARVRQIRARPIDFARPGWFRMRVVRHFIYYRAEDDRVLVLRILHDSMDETLHLP